MVNAKKKLTSKVNKVNEMTKAAYARYKGVSKPMVSKWLNDGRLVMTKDGRRVMVNESDERIKQTAHLNNFSNDSRAEAARVELDEDSKEKSFQELTAQVNNSQLDLEGDDAQTLFNNAKALREKATALQAAAEHEHYIGQMVKREVIGRAIFDILRALRDSMTGIGRRISVDVAVNTNAVECEKIISSEINQALENVTKELNARI